MTSVLYLFLLPAKIAVYTTWFTLFFVWKILNMGSLLDALFRGLTGSDKVSQVEEGEKETAVCPGFPSAVHLPRSDVPLMFLSLHAVPSQSE
jgi:hypothetical protein